MALPRLVASNLLFHRRKVLPVVLLCALILLLPAASWLLVERIISLADRPLAALDTELILQLDQGGKDPASIRTRGLVEPFNLHSFAKDEAKRKLAAIKGLGPSSSALLLWQFDPANTLTVVGLDPADPPVGLRKIESLLRPGGRFFSAADTTGTADTTGAAGAAEVIVERHFAALYGHKPGGHLELAGQQLEIIGLVDFSQESNLNNAALFLPYATALKLAGGGEPIINQLYLSLESAAAIEQVKGELAASFPGFSLISRDSLYQNLSALNRLIYQGGHLFLLLTLPLAALLLFWVLKIHRLEFADQSALLQTLGWPAATRRHWLLWELVYLLGAALLLAAVLALLLNYQLLPRLQLGPLLDQGFKP